MTRWQRYESKNIVCILNDEKLHTQTWETYQKYKNERMLSDYRFYFDKSFTRETSKKKLT